MSDFCNFQPISLHLDEISKSIDLNHNFQIHEKASIFSSFGEEDDGSIWVKGMKVDLGLNLGFWMWLGDGGFLRLGCGGRGFCDGEEGGGSGDAFDLCWNHRQCEALFWV